MTRPPVAAVAVIAAFVAGAVASSQSAAEDPLTQQQVESALKVLTPRRVIGLVRERGTTFILDAAGERNLRSLGSTASVAVALLDELVSLLTPPRNPSTGVEWIPPTDRRPMIWVPPGSFEMGSPSTEPGREPDEVPHSVTVAGFWLESTEVTYRAYQRFILAHPDWQKGRIDARLHDGNYLADWTGNNYPPGKADAPVVNVSWYAARAYASWAGKRLPTEAEWEYSGRAGTRSAYWWGDSFEAGPVGGGPNASMKHPWGLASMLGGVWEWTSSLYRNYPFANDGRNDPSGQGPRVIRGGVANSGPAILRSANWNRDAPERCSDLLGFRCAL
jgi:formylglycine-generating enzyme required for sulfatase activity